MSEDKNLLKQLNNSHAEFIEMSARRAGFDLFGVTPIGEMKTEINALDDWASKKYYGDMNWFTDSLDKRKDILKVMPSAKSVICVAMNYYGGEDEKRKNKSFGQIARYAYGRDYHKIFDKKLKLFAQKLKEIFPDNDFTPPLEANKYATKNNKFYSNIREPRAGFKYYSDTGPILERVWAERASLGFIGKNTNLITKYGSWVLLGEIITNIDFNCSSEQCFEEHPQENLLGVLQYNYLTAKQIFRGRTSVAAGSEASVSEKHCSEKQKYKQKQLSNCGSCRRCLDVCPTGALVAMPTGRQAPYVVDARKCISYLTIEHKGEIPVELREKMGNRIFGCDACQEICPFNIGRQKKGSDFELTEKEIAGSARDLKEILSIKTDEEFLEKISPPFERTARSARHEDCNNQEKSSKQSVANIAEKTKMSARRAGFAGSPVMRAKRTGLVRNACIAAGNSGDKALLPYLKKCSNDEDEIIASHARWAIERLEAGK